MEDIVISGISCRLPESNNVEEFWENLVKGRDMVTEDDRRWPPGIFGLPRRNGKIPDLTHFDAEYFSVPPKQADKMDPQLRLLMEVTYETLLDSGVSFQDLQAQSTGVFVGSTFNDAHDLLSSDGSEIDGYEMTGCNRAMLANRLSYFFDLKGPSFSVDSACSSGLEAFCGALHALRSGRCERALVATANLLLKPETSLQFMKLNMLSPDGACKSFDKTANGYVRSEGVIAILLERRAVAHKAYISVVEALDNSDGYKPQGISFPSGTAQRSLLEAIYKRAGINPATVSYVEAHGTGTQAGDPQELNTLAAVMGYRRQGSLRIGSCKSNMGHSEASAGLAAILKVILAYQHGCIPANLHYIEPNPEIPGLKDGRLRVVDKNMPWEGGIVGVNSFGFGGGNVHVILNAPVRKDTNQATPSKLNIPRLLLCGGNTEETVDKVLSASKDHSLDVLRRALEKQAAGASSKYQPARGFAIPEAVSLETTRVEKTPRELWFVYPGMGSQWPGMGKELLCIPRFKYTIEKCHKALSQEGFDLNAMLLSDDTQVYSDPLHAFVGICAIQLGLTSLLLDLGLQPSGIVGHSVGELGCAYADNTLTVEQTIMAAYWRGRCIQDAQLKPGAMAAVGLTWEECTQQCPPGVVPACHNATGTVTVSGAQEAVTAFVAELKEQGVFAREVDSSGVAFHSQHMQPCAPLLRQALQKIITKPVKRSRRWQSSSLPVDQWSSDLAKYASADYLVNNLVSPVRFKEALEHVPKEAVIIEIGPHGLLSSVIKRELGRDTVCLSTMKKMHDKNLFFFLLTVGKCYLHGLNPEISRLYGKPKEVTVGEKPPILSSLVTWNHSATWNVPRPRSHTNASSVDGGGIVTTVDLSKDSNHFFLDHVIDGRVLYPAAGYIVLAWEALAAKQGVPAHRLDVTIDKLQIHDATILKPNEKYSFKTLISETSGKFEITEGSMLKCSGVIKVVGTKNTTNPEASVPGQSQLPKPEAYRCSLAVSDIYQELRLRGYDYGENFRSVKSYHYHEKQGEITHRTNWVTFLDALLHLLILEEHADRSLKLPTRIQQLKLLPSRHRDTQPEMKVDYESHLKQIRTEASVIKGVTFTTSSRNQNLIKPFLELYHFQPYMQWKAAPPPTPKTAKPTSTELVARKGINYVRASTFSFANSVVLEFGIEPSTVDKFADEDTMVIRSTLNTALENLMKQRLVIGSVLNSDMGIKAMRMLAEVTHGQPNIQCDIWTAETPSLSKAGNLLNESTKVKIVPQSEVTQSIKGVDVLVMDTVETNGTLGELQNHAVFIFVSTRDQAHTLINRKSNGVKFNVIVCRESSNFCTLVVKLQKTKLEAQVVEVSSNNFRWIQDLKVLLIKGGNTSVERIWLVSTSNKPTGLVGFMNCLLQEPNTQHVRCLINVSDKEEHIPHKFLPGNSGFDELVQKDIVFNVYKDGIWGHFEKASIHSDTHKGQVADVFLDILAKGDLSSLTWVELPPNPSTLHIEPDTVCVTHAALNFRDVMIATGRLAVDALPGSNDTPLGLEFAGYDHKNRRLMGIQLGKSLSSRLRVSSTHTWPVPRHWPLADAATVPIAYLTAFYALICRANMQRGDTVLIHSATSAVGLAALRIAQSVGCEVFVTAGTQAKRQYLATECSVPLNHISNSRDLSFVSNFLQITEGKGVDIVLNSLAEEKLKASLDVLAENGQFLEIGKYDLSQDTLLGMSVFLKNISFHGIQVEQLFTPGNRDFKRVHALVEEGIESGVVVPLTLELFPMQEVEAAFRYMAEGVHIGKIVIQINNTKCSSSRLSAASLEEPHFSGFHALRRTYFHPNKVYIITGGLGGLGMELCDWLIQRGARYLILTGRRGVTTGYQTWVLERWRARGVTVCVSRRDVQIQTEAELLFKETLALGPIGGIFHLAAVLKDAHLGSQTLESFQEVCNIKVNGINHLDNLSRQLCRDTLDHFVAFSSAASGFGNAGQTNYGFANSYMERVCEKRVKDGLIGKAIQWGFIGDVGIVQNTLGGNSHYHMGMVPQRIPSFLEVLDYFMLGPGIVYSSVVPAPRNMEQNLQPATKKDNRSETVVATIANIIGIKDTSKVHPTVSLLEMGLDSLMTTEIRQVLGRRFDMQLSVADVQSLTLEGLIKLCSK